MINPLCSYFTAQCWRFGFEQNTQFLEAFACNHPQVVVLESIVCNFSLRSGTAKVKMNVIELLVRGVFDRETIVLEFSAMSLLSSEYIQNLFHLRSLLLLIFDVYNREQQELSKKRKKERLVDC